MCLQSSCRSQSVKLFVCLSVGQSLSRALELLQSVNHSICCIAGTLDSEIEKVLSFYADVSTSIKQELQNEEESFDHFQGAVMDSEELDTEQKLHRVDDKIEELQSVAKRITDLLQYVSLNMQGIRKILKKFAKHVEPTKPSPGFLALEIQHPHEPGWKMMQVRHCYSVNQNSYYTFLAFCLSPTWQQHRNSQAAHDLTNKHLLWVL